MTGTTHLHRLEDSDRRPVLLDRLLPDHNKTILRTADTRSSSSCCGHNKQHGSSETASSQTQLKFPCVSLWCCVGAAPAVCLDVSDSRWYLKMCDRGCFTACLRSSSVDFKAFFEVIKVKQ